MALSNIRSCHSQPLKIHILLNLLFIFFLFLLPPANSISFNYSPFKPNDVSENKIALEEDAYLFPEGLQLTKDKRSEANTNSVGRATHNEPVPLFHQHIIKNLNPKGGKIKCTYTQTSF